MPEENENQAAQQPEPTQPDAPPPLPKPEPARWPGGFWARTDYLLHHPGEVMVSLQRGEGLWQVAWICLATSVVMSAIYGAVMGSTNFLQGEDFSLAVKLGMMLNTAVKVPVLFLLTLFIVLPPIYVSIALSGTRLSFRQVMGWLLAATAVMATTLASMATVAFFFGLTTNSYNFMKLLHVLFFAYAGVVGIRFLLQCFDELWETAGKRPSSGLLFIWLLLYGFVGTQLAWVLRPYIFSPGQPFELFRPREGNFYESVWRSLLDLLGVLD